jgi:hypothetical protein
MSCLLLLSLVICPSFSSNSINSSSAFLRRNAALALFLCARRLLLLRAPSRLSALGLPPARRGSPLLCVFSFLFLSLWVSVGAGLSLYEGSHMLVHCVGVGIAPRGLSCGSPYLFSCFSIFTRVYIHFSFFSLSLSLWVPVGFGPSL